MNQSRGESNRRRRARVIALAAAVSLVSVAIAEEVSVRRPVDVLEDKTAASDIVETVKQPGTLTVLGHEDKWVHVKTADGKEGYVSAAVISANTGGGGLDLSGLTGGPSAGQMSAGNAGKGFDSNVDGYASSRGLSKAGLEKMIQFRNGVSGKDYKQFTTDGNVGPNHK